MTGGITLRDSCEYCEEGLGERKTIHVKHRPVASGSARVWVHEECLKSEVQDWHESHGEGEIPDYAPDWLKGVVGE